MGFFDDDKRMYIPLSIDNTSTKRYNYFFSNRKVMEMFLALLPYFLFMFPILQGGVKLIPAIIITVVYIVLYIYFLRFRIFEEIRLRNMVNELDNNKISGLEHFWQINKITDSGVIHYSLDSRVGKELGIIITYERGSKIGVPVGDYRNYRKTKQEFLRELSLQNFDFTSYEIPKRSKTPDCLVHYFNLMTTNPNEDFRKLFKLQIDINNAFVTDTEQTYIEYILIRNHNFRTLRRFRQIVQDVIENSLAKNNYFINPHILDKKEIESFFEDYLLVKAIDSDKVRRGVSNKPFSEFAKVTRIIQHNGQEVPIEFIDRFDLDKSATNYSVEKLLKKEENLINNKTTFIRVQKQKELDRIRKLRLQDKITNTEYQQMLNEVELKFDQEIQNVPLTIKKKEQPKKQPKKVKTQVEQPIEEIVSLKDNMVLKLKQEMAEKLAKSKETQKLAQPTEELSIEKLLARKKGDGK